MGTLRNCCFESKVAHRNSQALLRVFTLCALQVHTWLLGEEIDLLPTLVLPLAGPEEFDEDDYEKMPADLQYLPPDKEREPDADIRKMLLESLIQVTRGADCRYRFMLRVREIEME